MRFTRTKILAILLLNTGLAFAQDTIDIRNNSEAKVYGISLASTMGIINSIPIQSSVEPRGIVKVKFKITAVNMKKYALLATDPLTNRDIPIFYSKNPEAKIPIAITNYKFDPSTTFIYITSQSKDGIFANCLGKECSTLDQNN